MIRRTPECQPLTRRHTGGEANIAVALANWGMRCHLVSAVPDNDIGDACINTFRAYGIGVQHVVRQGDRLGIYYLENGVAQRPGKVIYDRAHSAFVSLRMGQLPWQEILHGKSWLHLTGTACALTAESADVAVEACQAAAAVGTKVSLDPNFRRTLWRWDGANQPERLAGRTLRKMLPHVHLLITNPGQAADLFDVKNATGLDDLAPDQAVGRCTDIARQLARQSDSIEIVAMTLRQTISASNCRWAAMLYDVKADCSFVAPLTDGLLTPYEIAPIVDRVGSGDAFAAGLLRGLMLGLSDQETISFATAAGCLKHAVPGDFLLASLAEVEAVAAGGVGHIQR